MKHLACLWALLVCACPPTPRPPVPPPGSATCADVCRHYGELGCEAARPTGAGAVCVDVCQNVQDSTVVHWDLDCRARALTCAAADACESESR